MASIWKPVIGYEGLYEVSSDGVVKSVRFNRPMMPSNNGTGYSYTSFYKNGIRKGMLVHRVVAETFIPNPERKKYVNHIDGNKMNNKVENLEWVTCSENHNHALDRGLMKSGERSSSAKLQDFEVVEIRKMYATGKYTLAALGSIYSVSFQHISDIINNKKRKRG